MGTMMMLPNYILILVICICGSNAIKCKFNSIEYEVGQTVPGQCPSMKCGANGIMELNGEVQGYCKACVFAGASYVRSFDDLEFDTYGRCSYALLQVGYSFDPPFVIYGRFKKFGSFNHLSGIDYLDIVIYGNHVSIGHETDVMAVKINDNDITATSTAYHDPDVNVMIVAITDTCVMVVIGFPSVMVKLCRVGDNTMVKIYVHKDSTTLFEGICGNNDNIKSNDLMSRDGTTSDVSIVAEFEPAIFVNKWKKNGGVAGCPSPKINPRVNLDMCQTHVAYIESLCNNQIKNQGLQNVDYYYTTCFHTICKMWGPNSGATGDEFSAGYKSFTSFLSEVIKEQRTQENSPSNQNQVDTGFCEYNGTEYISGTVLSSNCLAMVCAAGQWKFNGKWFGSGVCAHASMEDPVTYNTFDGIHYIFPEPCSYSLVQYGRSLAPSYMLSVDIDSCDGASDLYCVKTVTFQDDPNTVITTYYDNGFHVSVNGHENTLTEWVQYAVTENGDTGVLISQTDHDIYIIGTQGLSISICRLENGVLKIDVGAKNELSGYLFGMLGFFDGNYKNDLTSRDGSITNNPDITKICIPRDFAESWKTSDQTGAQCQGVARKMKKGANKVRNANQLECPTPTPNNIAACEAVILGQGLPPFMEQIMIAICSTTLTGITNQVTIDFYIQICIYIVIIVIRYQGWIIGYVPPPGCTWNGAVIDHYGTLDNYCVDLRCLFGEWVSLYAINPCCGSCSIRDDPHQITCLGTRFDYHGKCNTALTQPGVSRNPPFGVFGDFTECMRANRRATCIEKITFKNDVNSVISIIKANSGFTIEVDGNGVSLPTTSEIQFLGSLNNVLTWIDEDGCLNILGSNQIWVIICRHGYFVQVYIRTHCDLFGQLYGLLGHCLLGTTNDLFLRNGTTVPLPTNHRENLVEFGDNWKAADQTKAECASRDYRTIEMEPVAKHITRKAERLCTRALKEFDLERHGEESQRDFCVSDVSTFLEGKADKHFIEDFLETTKQMVTSVLKNQAAEQRSRSARHA